MIPTNNETYEFECYKRHKNSKYDYDDYPTIVFNGRPANTLERKNYRIIKGVNGNSDSQFVFVSNLPENVDIGDQIHYLGKMWVVQSIGYYFDASKIVNAKAFNEEQIISKCPKGINIQ